LAYPIPDDAIRDHLVPTIFSNDQPILTTRYLRFLRCVFRQINDELEQCKELLRQANIQTAEDLARWWSKHLEGRRKELYQAMIDGSREAISVRTCEDGTSNDIHRIGRSFLTFKMNSPTPLSMILNLRRRKQQKRHWQNLSKS
jgi:hypothetical protein